MTEALKPESQNAGHNFWLRLTMNLARQAMSHGNHPFGALWAYAHGAGKCLSSAA